MPTDRDLVSKEYHEIAWIAARFKCDKQVVIDTRMECGKNGKPATSRYKKIYPALRAKGYTYHPRKKGDPIDYTGGDGTTSNIEGAIA